MRITACLVVWVLLAGVVPARAQQTPVVDFETALDTPFYPQSGMVRFDTYVIAFAPEGTINGEVALLGGDGSVIARFPFFNEYKAREGVFGRVQAQGPASVELTESGEYILAFAVDGKPVTRLPFTATVGGGDDPFNPRKTWHFQGPWHQFAHLTMNTLKEQWIPQVNLWVGGGDLPEGKSKDAFEARLHRDGVLVAHNKQRTTHIATGHYKRVTTTLFHPHEERNPNPEPFTLEDWRVDGAYELRIVRASDEKIIRSFRYTAADGKIQPMTRTQLNHEPRVDYIAPRVVKKHSNTFEMVEAIWLDGSAPVGEGE